MTKCTSCIHYIVCFRNNLILDPLHGGIPCADYDSKDNYTRKEVIIDKSHGYWTFKIELDKENNLLAKTTRRTCSACGDERFTPFTSEYCPKCGAIMDLTLKETEKILEEI